MAKYGYRGSAVYIEASDMQKIPGNILDALNCGDFVIKHTVEGGKDLYHYYAVSHKQETGICITYNTTGYSETISYDKVDGVWTFNSQDVWQAQ